MHNEDTHCNAWVLPSIYSMWALVRVRSLNLINTVHSPSYFVLSYKFGQFKGKSIITCLSPHLVPSAGDVGEEVHLYPSSVHPKALQDVCKKKQ